MDDEHRIARLLLGLTPGDGVLDVACGPGNFTRDFARVVGVTGLAVGIDASPTMLARAVRDTPASEYDNVAYVRADAVDLPFRARASTPCAASRRCTCSTRRSGRSTT
jgi:ubiquinone/menaquinone biosynthesis C-methylase UbiE